MQPSTATPLTTREVLAGKYLRGKGIEIGALHYPLPLPPGVRARYVDRLPVSGLRNHYPELRDCTLVEPDILDNGETLVTIPDRSQDFVIANHFLEHCENPLGTLRTISRVLRRGGVAFLAIPDKRRTFDRDRPLTPFAHLLDDLKDGGASSRWAHYREWAYFFECRDDPPAHEQRIRDLEAKRYSIHFHVWDRAAMDEIMAYAEAHCALRLLEVRDDDVEWIFLLEKTGD